MSLMNTSLDLYERVIYEVKVRERVKKGFKMYYVQLDTSILF